MPLSKNNYIAVSRATYLESDKKREQKIVTIVIRYGQKVSNSRWHERLWDDGGVCDKIMISYQYRGRWSGGTGKNTYRFA